MGKYRYIAFLIALVGIVSCTKYDEYIPSKNTGNSVKVVGRVLSYSNLNVGTRANDKVGDEGNTACMCLVVFDDEGICKRKEFSPSSNPTFTIDKSSLESGDMLYIFANIPNPQLDAGSNLDDFLQLTSNVSGVTEIPEFEYDYSYVEGGETKTVNIKQKCFPMIGSMEITSVDDLQAIISIGLESVYSKIVVNILSKPDQKVDGISPASFSLTGFDVYNVGSTVDFVGGTEGTSNDNVTVLDEVFKGKHIVSDFAQSDKQASFYFYLPERFLKPATPAENYDYPFGKISSLDDDEKQKLPQRFKPKLAKDNGLDASYVRFYGEYIDHQGQNWNVSYDIYVGNDNYGNFDIVRNTQYTNTVTIKGITTSNDQALNLNSISIDHRVDVERVSPIIVNLRRETLLDSHFEVRPLRIRKNGDFKGQDLQGVKVSVEILNAETPDNTTDANRPDWIRIEHKNNDGGNTATYLESGKRRYFTYGLVTGKDVNGNVEGNNLSGSFSIIDIPVTDANQTVWVYVDECITPGDDVRSAIIRVSSKDANGNNLGDPVDYYVNQRMLFPVKYTNGTDNNNDDITYNIEYHEEYLYNYDAEDDFGQTEWEGMQWGLNGAQLSFDKNAILMSKGSWGTINTSIAEAISAYSPKYDFYLSRDIKYDDWSFNDEDDYNNLVHNHNGFDFCNLIIADLKNSERDTKTDEIISILNLSEDPKSAIEYCYNKNKRNSNGEVVDPQWYLPAIDEIEEIVMSQYGDNLENYTYSRFTDFRAKKYWSSQPAYLNNYVFVERLLGDRWGEYMIDNTTRARATSVLYNGQGATNPSNYSKITSGMSGYSKYIDADYSDITGISNTQENNVPENGKTFSGSNRSESWTHTITPPIYEEGALLRTDYARVRCVRKLPATN